jgi:hypothetical protein
LVFGIADRGTAASQSEDLIEPVQDESEAVDAIARCLGYRKVPGERSVAGAAPPPPSAAPVKLSGDARDCARVVLCARRRHCRGVRARRPSSRKPIIPRLQLRAAARNGSCNANPRMRRSLEGSEVVVVVEREAACTEWMDHWGPQPETWGILEQEEGECSTGFAERLRRTLDRFSADARSSAVVVLVLGPCWTFTPIAERLSRAQSCLRHLARFPWGMLILTTGYQARPAQHDAPRLMADELSEDPALTHVHIVQRQTDSAATSKVRATRIRPVPRPPSVSARTTNSDTAVLYGPDRGPNCLMNDRYSRLY